MEKDLEQLEQRVKVLEDIFARMEKQGIVVVGDFDGTDIPVTVHGVRRKITTSAP